MEIGENNEWSMMETEMFLDEFKGTYVTVYAYFCLSIGITTWTDKDNDLVVFRTFDYVEGIIVLYIYIP